MNLSMTHTAAEGTLIDGTTKGDGSAEILKRNGWRWGRGIACWYLPRSRDTAPRDREITRTAKQLRENGFSVDIEVDSTYRTVAEAEATALAQQEHRVTALTAKADRKATAAAAADQAAERAHEALPPMGEPVKIGHHSEGRHRAALTRADATMRRSITADQEARTAQEQVTIAAATTDQRYAPQRVANRIDRLEREHARWLRHRDGSSRTLAGGFVDVTAPATGEWADRVVRELAHVADQLEYWRNVRTEQIAAGTATDYSSKTIRPGDLIKYSGVWAKVTRSNPKTVTTVGSVYGEFKVHYTHIVEHRPAAKAEAGS